MHAFHHTDSNDPDILVVDGRMPATASLFPLLLMLGLQTWADLQVDACIEMTVVAVVVSDMSSSPHILLEGRENHMLCSPFC